MKKNITDWLSKGKGIPKDMPCKPVFFNLQSKSSKNELSLLLESNPTIQILDEIGGQLEELIKLKNPKQKFTSKELHQEILAHLKNTPIQEYGVWVYYPWLNKLIHLLNEEEFIDVRTNRNQYKITPKEENILSTKKIGIIGLSVGKAIALTMALERICGELVLADFDVIELSNLNRIQTGVHNFGVKKTIVVAREIAEIDPYIKVTCIHNGLTEENTNDFFTKNGKLDICVEVCDGLHTKIFARQKAKELRIPVVMNSSDRGTTDIERFDLDPNLPILHGLIDHLDISKIKEAKTNEEKVPYLLPMLGVETSSERLKASMLEIEETITTWPQLASGVIFGGGICTDVCRRILLNKFTKSGRYFVDTEELINNEVSDSLSSIKTTKPIYRIPETNINDYKDVLVEINNKLFSNLQEDSCELQSNEIDILVNHAIMAPSGGNIQPWKCLYKNKTLLLFNDINRTDSILNYKNSAGLISHGAATENIILKSHELGYEVELSSLPLNKASNLIATFKFYKKKTEKTEKHSNDHLVTFIPKRITNRTLGKKTALKEEDKDYLCNAISSIKEAELKIFTDDVKIEELKDVLAEVNRLFMINPAGHSQFVNEIRWNQKEVEETRDGIDINTIDLTPSETAGFIVSKDWNVTKHVKQWNLGKAFGKLSNKSVNASSALGIITMPKTKTTNFFDGGRALQKVWLAATEKGIAFQPMSIATFLFARISDGNNDYIEDIEQQLQTHQNKLNKLCNIENDRQEVFIFRIGHAKEPSIKALRRPLENILMYG